MANLSDIYIKTETLQILLDTAKKKDMKGVSITVSTDDKSNKWGQNVSAFVSQSKEEREAKKDRFYVGNGKVFWTDGKIVKAEKVEEPGYSSQESNDGEDRLPF